MGRNPTQWRESKQKRKETTRNTSFVRQSFQHEQHQKQNGMPAGLGLQESSVGLEGCGLFGGGCYGGEEGEPGDGEADVPQDDLFVTQILQVSVMFLSIN